MSTRAWKTLFRYKFIFVAIAILGIFFLTIGLYKTSMSYKTYNAGSNKTAQSESVVYENSLPPFTFHYPAGFAVTRMPGEAGDTLLVKSENLTTSDVVKLSEFQIYISLYDDDISTFTLERIRQDIPDIIVEEPQEILITKDKSVHALMFFSPNGGSRTREIWFVANGYLFQASGFEGTDAIMGEVLNTIEF